VISCPNCLKKELVGSLFCTECGEQLVDDHGTSPLSQPEAVRSSTSEVISATQEQEFLFPPPIQDAPFALNIISSGKIIPIRDYKEITIGRYSKGAPLIPDVDLSDHKAYESGVSRIHASIQISEECITVTDLESVNGTRINGRKITPNEPYTVKNGDILTLGKFKIQILQQS